jgi:hypothetical protein
MKTHLISKNLMFFALISLIISSCSKKDDTLQPVYTPPVGTGTANPIGTIVDSGLVDTNTRVMKMEISTMPYTFYGSNEEVSYVSASTSVSLYVNEDGLIPTGEYSLASPDSKAPFTFSSGVLNLISGGDSNGSTTDQIVGGKINIVQDGDKYAVSFHINLASGKTTSEIFSGSLAYADSK